MPLCHSNVSPPMQQPMRRLLYSELLYLQYCTASRDRGNGTDTGTGTGGVKDIYLL